VRSAARGENDHVTLSSSTANADDLHITATLPRQEAQLSLANRSTLVHAKVKISLTQNATKQRFPCCTVKSSPLVNDCDIVWSPDFRIFAYNPSPIWCPEWVGYPWAVGFIFGVGKLEWLGYNLVKVAWWSTQSFGHNTSTWQTHRQPRRHS